MSHSEERLGLGIGGRGTPFIRRLTIYSSKGASFTVSDNVGTMSGIADSTPSISIYDSAATTRLQIFIPLRKPHTRLYTHSTIVYVPDSPAKHPLPHILALCNSSMLFKSVFRITISLRLAVNRVPSLSLGVGTRRRG